MKAEPISIRVDGALVDVLKEEARRQAYQKKSDISYMDLIRDAVQGYASKIEQDAMLPALDGEVILGNHATVMSNLSSVLSSCSNESEWLSLFGFIRNPLSSSLQDHARSAYESLSLARAVLTLETDTGRNYDRSLYGPAYVIERRGAYPDVIIEGESYLVPTFQIACNPTIHLDKILKKDLNDLANLASQSGTSIAREEDANFCALLASAGADNEYRKPIEVESITLSTLSQGYDMLVRDSQTPKHLLLSPSTFSSLSRMAASQPGNWSFEPLRMDNQPVGHYQDAVIRVTDRIEDSAYFVAEDAGYLVEKQPLKALIHPNPTRLRGSVVMWIDIGMTIIADYKVSCVKCKS